MKESYRRSLEGLKVFPIIAWTILFLFSYFVYSMVLELRAVSAELRTSTERLERAVAEDPSMITSFE